MGTRPWEPPASGLSAEVVDEGPTRVAEPGQDAGLLGGVQPRAAAPSGDVPSDAVGWGSRRADVIPPRPGARRPLAFDEPSPYDDQDAPTTRLRRVPARGRARTAVAAACVVLGLGLIGGAVTGSWLTADAADPTERSRFAAAADTWHSEPVDTLLPAVVKGEGAGPGGADRRWTRIAVAPDSECAGALDPLLLKALEPVGCERLVRATYTDDTRSHVTTVGMVFSEADEPAMRALRARFAKDSLERRDDLMPRTYPARGTVAEGFGDRQRATWTVSVLTDAPVVVYAVSGFADGRTVSAPEPVADALATDATSAPAQAGLGHEAKGLADRVERTLRKTVSAATEKPA
ncbi:hypothetical protein [Streptomyces apocyni]|uniref:hypothetical protein n=1 Tax=Streptomyces apocyni TaxID=2654677 RepID=UPI002D7EF701|nr:hypothetical protein [Streptomyces apocyni]